MKNRRLKLYFIVLFFLLILIFFGKGLNNYFLGDDWFHLNITQINNLREFFNFFNPFKNPQQTAFYRPIPNQLFFFLNQSLFGFRPFYYHLSIYLLYIASIYLFNRLLIILNFSQKSRHLAILIFALSATHFTRLFFISAGQEVFMVFFVLLYLVLFLTEKNRLKIKAQLCLVLALLSKDTAVIAPIILFFLKNKNLLINSNDLKNTHKIKQFIVKNLDFLLSLFFVCFYLFIRFYLFDQHMLGDEAYHFSFSIKEIVTSTYFYFWWLLGAPELIQDYMPKFYLFLPRFFSDFGWFAYLIIILSILLLVLLIINFVINFKSLKHLSRLKKIFFAFIFIFIGLLPVIFLPKHRFTIQLGLPMLGMAMLLAIFLDSHKKQSLTIVTVLIFLALNFASIKMSEKSHYSITRAHIAEKAFDYFTTHYPKMEPNSIVFITNGQTVGHDVASWGSSRQVAFALWHDNFIQALYKDKTIRMEYEDLPKDDLADILADEKTIYVSAEEFLN